MPIKSKSPSHIFNIMGLTIARPGDLDAYRDCCHYKVAKAIALDEVEPEHEIVLVGRMGNAYHSFIADGERLVVDDMRTIAPKDPVFNAKTGDYVTQFNNRDETLQTVARMTVGAFRRQYVDPLKP